MCWGLGNVEGCVQRSRVLSHRYTNLSTQILWVEDTCFVFYKGKEVLEGVMYNRHLFVHNHILLLL